MTHARHKPVECESEWLFIVLHIGLGDLSVSKMMGFNKAVPVISDRASTNTNSVISEDQKPTTNDQRLQKKRDDNRKREMTTEREMEPEKER